MSKKDIVCEILLHMAQYEYFWIEHLEWRMTVEAATLKKPW